MLVTHRLRVSGRDLGLERRGQFARLVELEKTTGSLFEIGLASEVLSVDDKHHVEVEALGNTSEAWWPDHLYKGEILRCAYIQALKLALFHKTPKPSCPTG